MFKFDQRFLKSSVVDGAGKSEIYLQLRHHLGRWMKLIFQRPPFKRLASI